MDDKEVVRTCRHCYNLILQGSKFCPDCGTEVKDDYIVNRTGQNIILSSGNYTGSYDVIGLVHQYHLTLNNKEKFGEKNLSFDDTVDKIIDLLIDETIEAGGDGIIFLRVEFHAIQLGGSQIFVYGTMIKSK
jgi:hypothetical protein